VSAGLVAGWGVGVAAPWPMPVAAVIMAVRARRTAPDRLAGGVCAGLGIGCIVGIVSEPVSWRPRSWTRWTGLAIICNLAASAALTVAGWHHFTGARAGSPAPACSAFTARDRPWARAARIRHRAARWAFGSGLTPARRMFSSTAWRRGGGEGVLPHRRAWKKRRRRHKINL
jgi:hypothetical protein